MIRYFGYGSNMSDVALKAKGVRPEAAEPAILRGWRLVFNIPDFFSIEGGTGNVERATDDEVHGVVYTCKDTDLDALDELEALGVSYARTLVDVTTYAGEQVRACIYVGIPAKLRNGYRPSRRYRAILVAGAEAMGLRADYIKRLRSVPVHTPSNPPAAFAFPDGPRAEFTENDLTRLPFHTALGGAVFDMQHARAEHAYLKQFLAGKDVTLFFLRRMDSSDGTETRAAYLGRQLTEEQQRFINEYLHEFAREYRFVGRMDFAKEWPTTAFWPLPTSSGAIPESTRFWVPARQVLDRAERTNRELGHENLGFLSETHGFMPRSEPRQRMPHAYAAWDEVASRLPELYASLKLRRTIRELPILSGRDDALPDAYLLRAAAILALLSHAYYYVDVEPPDAIPDVLAKPWAEVRERLGRQQEVLSYIDLIVYNWRLLDAALPDPMRVENMRLLIPTVDTAEERTFYLTQSEILSRTTPVIGAVVRAQEAVVHDNPGALKRELALVIETFNRIVRDSLLKINPSPSGPTYVDPVIWAKTVAPFAVPFHQGVQGPSGTSSPIFNLVDTFLGRKRHASFLGKEIRELRSGYPTFWRDFIEAVGEVSVADYVDRVDDAELRGLLKETVEVYAGDHGFLGRHRMKVYGYLELAFKVGRSVTIGGFSGLFRDRTWDQVDSELEYARAERLESFPKRCHYGTIKDVRQTHAGAPDGTCHVVIDVTGSGIRYAPGDRCGVLPENDEALVERTLEALKASGAEPVPLTSEWEAHVRLRWGYEKATSLSLRELLRFGRIRPVVPRVAEALHAVTQNDALRDAILTHTTERWEVWDLVRMLEAQGFDPTRLWKADGSSSEHIARIVPPENFRSYSISSVMHEGEDSATEIHLTVGRIRYRSEATDYAPATERFGSASNFLARVANRKLPIALVVEHPPRFSLPKDPKRPIVMLSGGTGISPFRSFILHRQRLEETGDAWLFLGLRSREYLYYKEELVEPLRSGRLSLSVAFSRDDVAVQFAPGRQAADAYEFVPDKSKYIDELLLEENNARALWTLLQATEDGGQGAYVYVCGRSRFARSVIIAFKQILARYAPGDDAEKERVARAAMAKLVGEGRFLQEIFTDARPWTTERTAFRISDIVLANDDEHGYRLVIDDRVYDLTEFLELHPGGNKVLLGYAGMDASHGYARAHPGQSEVDAMREMYEAGVVGRPDFRGATRAVQRDGVDVTVSLAGVYRAWTQLTYLVVEMQNALRNDLSLQDGITARGDPVRPRSLYKLGRAVETHERFLKSYLDGLAGDPVRSLWSLTVGVCDEAKLDRSMEIEIQSVFDSRAARFVEGMGQSLKRAIGAATEQEEPITNPAQRELRDVSIRLRTIAERSGDRVSSIPPPGWRRGDTVPPLGQRDGGVARIAQEVRGRVDAVRSSFPGADSANDRLADAVEVLEREAATFLAQAKTLFREGLVLFEKHGYLVLDVASDDLVGVLTQFPPALASYFERTRAALEALGWSPHIEDSPSSRVLEPVSRDIAVIHASPYYRLELDVVDQVVTLRRSARAVESIGDLLEQNRAMVAAFAEAGQANGIVVDMRQAPQRNDPEFENAMSDLRKAIYKAFPRVAVLLESVVGVLQVNRLARVEGVTTLATLSEAAAIKFAKG